MILKVLGQKCNLGFKLIFGKVRIKLQYLILGNDFFENIIWNNNISFWNGFNETEGFGKCWVLFSE